MKRNDWKQKSKAYALGAKAMLHARYFDLAYHLAGVAVECALKAKIASRFRANEIPDKKLVNQTYAHDLKDLLKLAQLDAQHSAKEAANATFRTFWATVGAWQIDSRYQNWSQVEAEQMVEAVTHKGTGVLSWIARHS